MDLEELKASGLIIFEAISGSRAYGLATEQSDTDIRGVFVQPKEACLGFNPLGQIQNESSDIVFYEIGKFLELVSRNNPSALELLYTPDDCVISEHPSFAKIRSQNWLSKMCADTFLKYAMSQLKKARGLNKKIVNPVDKERKDVMDFCYVLEEGKARSLKPFLNEKGISPNSCGLAALSHVTDGYALYHSERHALRGILAKDSSHDVCVSSIPKELSPISYLFFSRDAYKVYSKKYSEYWEWVEKRNPERYQTNVSHNKNYDSKNLMHVFRLLSIAESIATKSTIDLRGADREFLLRVRAGEYEYEELIEKATQLSELLAERFLVSSLPEEPDRERIERELISVREEFYKA